MQFEKFLSRYFSVKTEKFAEEAGSPVKKYLVTRYELSLQGQKVVSLYQIPEYQIEDSYLELQMKGDLPYRVEEGSKIPNLLAGEVVGELELRKILKGVLKGSIL